MILLGIWTTFVSLWNPYFQWIGLFDQLLLYALVPLFSAIITSERKILNIIRTWVYSSIVVCMYYFIQKTQWDPLVWGNQVFNPVGSTWGNRNYLSFYLVSTLPFSLYLIRFSNSFHRILAILSTVFITLCILLSESRSATMILILLVPIALYWFSSTYDSKRFQLFSSRFAFISYVILLCILVISLFYLQDLSFYQWNSLMHNRIYLWESAWRMIQDNPFMGHGVFTFSILIGIYRKQEMGAVFGIEEVSSNAHNVMLESLVEIGFIGGVLFFLSILWYFLYPRIRKHNFTPLQKISCLSLFSIFIFSLTGEIANIPFCTFFSWLTLAIYAWHPSTNQTIILKQKVFLNGSIGILLLFNITFIYSQINAIKSNFITASVLQTTPSDQYPNAIIPLKKAIRFDSSNLVAKSLLSWAYLQKGSLTKSEMIAKQVIEKSPFFGNIRHLTGIHAYLRKDYMKAIFELTDALRIFPKEYRPAILLARAYYELKIYDQCQGVLDFMKGMKHSSQEMQALQTKLTAIHGISSHRP